MNAFESLFGPLTSLQNIRKTKEIQVYLMSSRRNLCKFYDSTVEKEAKYLITNIIMYFLSNLKVIYHTEDSTFYVDEFDNILLNYVPSKEL